MRARYEHSKLKIYSNWALKNSALALKKSYGMIQTCSFASILLLVKAIQRSGDTVWAKYEYEIELRLKIVRFSIQFGFDSSTDGKMNWNIPNCFSWTLNMAENISNVWIYCKAEGMGKKWARNWANIYEFLFLSLISSNFAHFPWIVFTTRLSDKLGRHQDVKYNCWHGPLCPKGHFLSDQNEHPLFVHVFGNQPNLVIINSISSL